MLGALVSINTNGDSIQGTNHALYLKHLIKKEVKNPQSINVLVNEDDTNYVSYSILISIYSLDLLCIKRTG